MRNIIIKKKCLLFKHEKNNQTLSNDWPTYCHKGIWKGSVLSFLKDKAEWKMSDTGSAHWASSFLLNCIKYLRILSKTKKNLWTQNLIFWMKAHCPDPHAIKHCSRRKLTAYMINYRCWRNGTVKIPEYYYFICSNIPAAPSYGEISIDTIIQSLWFLSGFPW